MKGLDRALVLAHLVGMLSGVMGCGGKVSFETEAGDSCGWPETTADASYCGTNYDTDADGIVTCELYVCDTGATSQVWVSRCVGSTCSCLYNDEEYCSCRLDEPTTCTGKAPESCCPAPF